MRVHVMTRRIFEYACPYLLNLPSPVRYVAGHVFSSEVYRSKLKNMRQSRIIYLKQAAFLLLKFN